jgi:hypothetical protein
VSCWFGSAAGILTLYDEAKPITRKSGVGMPQRRSDEAGFQLAIRTTARQSSARKLRSSGFKCSIDLSFGQAPIPSNRFDGIHPGQALRQVCLEHLSYGAIVGGRGKRFPNH